MWPRRQRWSLMGSLAPPISKRFGQAAYEQGFEEGNVPSPNYEFFDEESGRWSADKNNAAINAAMDRPSNPSITRDASGEIPRIHPGAVARNWRHGQMMGPNYGIGSPYVLEAGGNAAINAAMARQAQIPQTSGAGGKWKKVIEQLGKLPGQEIKPDWDLAGQRVGPPTAWAHTNIPYAPTAGLMGFKKKKEGPY